MKLILIDGHAILHRAYHALPPLTDPNGEVINAIYGFMTMLLQVLETEKPSHLAIAFDRPEPTFRMQAYTQYQSKRPDMQSNLAEQIPRLQELLDILGIPWFSVAGFEADDCIGTLARQASEEYSVSSIRYPVSKKKIQNTEYRIPNTSLEVIIVTGDRDMLQLVNDQVKVMVPIKGLKETKTYDDKTIESEFGVKPAQWVDVKSLKGDASDNYPGVPGIGPKTAQDLILKFGTLENLYGKLGELGKLGEKEKKIAQKLAAGAESAGMGKKLAQIVCDVPGVHLDWGKARVEGIDWIRGIRFMTESFGFKTIVGRIEKMFLNKTSNAVNQLPNKKRDDGQMELI